MNCKDCKFCRVAQAVSGNDIIVRFDCFNQNGPIPFEEYSDHVEINPVEAFEACDAFEHIEDTDKSLNFGVVTLKDEDYDSSDMEYMPTNYVIEHC